MFNETTKAAWQGIEPGSALKERVLALEAQPQRKTIPFPTAKTVRKLASLAACIAVAVVLLNPAPRVALSGVGPGVAAAAFSRQIDAQPVTLLLDCSSRVQLTVSDGTLEALEEGYAWHLPGPGEYTVTATRGRHTTETHFQILREDGVLSVTTH